MSRAIEVRGEEGVHKMLRGYTNPTMDKRMNEATKAGAKALEKPMKAAMRPVSKRMARAVRVRRAKRDRPAWVLGSSRKVAFFWPFVIGGTRDHGPRRAKLLYFYGSSGEPVYAKRVRGVPPNPIVARVAKAHEAQVYAAIDRSLDSTEVK